MTHDETDASLETLLRAVLAGRGQALERATTLPPAAYSSEDFYQLEVERVLRREWLPIAHLSQLPEIGDYLCVDLLGELLVLIRGPDRLRALSRVCLHRWASLLQGAGNTRRFSCPAHKWTYDLTGRLVGAPLMEQVEFDARAHCLPEYRSEIVDGFVYVNFSAQAPPLAPRLSELSASWAPLAPERWLIGGTLEYDRPVNWKIVVETFMECYHHMGAHPETFEPTHAARDSYAEEGRRAWSVVHAPARPEAPDARLSAGFPQLDGLTAQERREFRVYLVYPCQLLALFPDRVFWFCLQPLGATRTRFQTHILVPPQARAQVNYRQLMQAELAFLARFNDEDIAINEMQQRGVSSHAAHAGRFSHLEKALWQFAEYLRERLTSDPRRVVAGSAPPRALHG